MSRRTHAASATGFPSEKPVDVTIIGGRRFDYSELAARPTSSEHPTTHEFAQASWPAVLTANFPQSSQLPTENTQAAKDHATPQSRKHTLKVEKA